MSGENLEAQETVNTARAWILAGTTEDGELLLDGEAEHAFRHLETANAALRGGDLASAEGEIRDAIAGLRAHVEHPQEEEQRTKLWTAVGLLGTALTNLRT